MLFRSLSILTAVAFAWGGSAAAQASSAVGDSLAVSAPSPHPLAALAVCAAVGIFAASRRRRR